MLLHGRRLPTTLSRRTLTAPALRLPSQLLPTGQTNSSAQKRNFCATRARCSASVVDIQKAPSSKPYLESGVIKPRDIVDVKKVLVIGSGGLAIGQAGEFDYSGTSIHYWPRGANTKKQSSMSFRSRPEVVLN